MQFSDFHMSEMEEEILPKAKRHKTNLQKRRTRSKPKRKREVLTDSTDEYDPLFERVKKKRKLKGRSAKKKTGGSRSVFDVLLKKK